MNINQTPQSNQSGVKRILSNESTPSPSIVKPQKSQRTDNILSELDSSLFLDTTKQKMEDSGNQSQIEDTSFIGLNEKQLLHA